MSTRSLAGDRAGRAGTQGWVRRVLGWLPGTLALGSISLAPACRGSGVPRSDWPPADFYLEVRGRTEVGGHIVEHQSLHVFADGFTVYREADPADAFTDHWPPVFSRASAYRMLPQSTRSLARSLYQTGLFQSETAIGTDVDAEEVVAIRWRAFGEERRTVARGRVYGPIVGALNVINAYLPSGCAFALPDMTGEAEPPRLSRVPQPVRSVSGAYRLHQAWADEWPQPDVQWQIELLALALRAGDAAGAGALVEQLAREEERYVEAFPDDARLSKAVIDRLRALVAQVPPAKGAVDAPQDASRR